MGCDIMLMFILRPLIFIGNDRIEIRKEYMTKELFNQDLTDRLKEQILLRPALEQEDAVKFVFQAMLGVGHLLSDPEIVTAYLVRETERLRADPDEPLLEQLSPAWCRLNLRRAMAEGLTPRMIAGMMLASGNATRFNRQDVYETCGKLAEEGVIRLTGTAELERVTDENRLPSHSAAYREKYRPAYRVISAAWIQLTEAVLRIARKNAGGGRLLVTLDGPCATGKTTLAEKLAQVFGAGVIHTDEYVIPHAQKTVERLSVPGGNCDAERLVREVAAPFHEGRPVRYRRYDCRADRFLDEEVLPPAQVLIIEGSYCSLPAIRKYADVPLFLDAPWSVREARLRERESPVFLRGFYERWIPLENAYFEAYGLPDEACTVIRQDPDSLFLP